MSSSTFRPENALEEALLRAYQADDLQALLPALTIADVYLPADDAPETDREVLAEAGDQIPLPVIDGPDGGRYVPVFSSLAQLAHVRPAGGGYRRLRGRSLAAIVPPDLGVALNPGGALGLPLSPDQVAQLANAPAVDGGETQFLLGEPREEPSELLDTMRRFAEERQDVRAAYRALLVRAPGAEPEHVIGLELAAGVDPQPVIDAAADAARAAGVDLLGLLPLQAGVDAGQVGRFMLTQTQPFWRREPSPEG
jgi:hypothetical protein